MSAAAIRVGVDLCAVDGTGGAELDALHQALAALVADPHGDIEIVVYAASPDVLPGDLARQVEVHSLPMGGLRLARPTLHRRWLPSAVDRDGVQVLHVAAGDIVPELSVPVVLGIRDLAALEMPASYQPLRLAQLRRNLPRAVAAAETIVVPSEFVRSRLHDRLDVAESRVQVVPWSLPRHAAPAPIDTVRARYGIIGRILLLPSATVAHKEHVVAIRALAHLVDRHKEMTLVLAGEAGPNERRVLREIDDRGLGGRVVRIEDVSDAVRSALFENAAAVVYPAVYGGFGAEVLEAMACGVPVVVADAGAAPELVDDAAAVVPPGDDVQLAIELHRVLDDAEWRRRRVEAGLVRASAFTPERSAAALAAAYRSVLVSK